MTQVVGANSRLPEEMRRRAQWCLAGPDKAPYLAGPSGLYHASPVKGPWLEYETACSYATQYGVGVGYIITSDDPYTCIDMDVKDIESLGKDGNPIPQSRWTTKYDLEFYSGIVQFAQSYTELSTSGKGLHIWVKGDIGPGRRAKGVEVYSRERFIICTGNPISEVQYDIINHTVIPKLYGTQTLPIVDGSLLLQNLAKELGSAESSIDLEEAGQSLTDSEIWSRAATASNGEKFQSLCAGDWRSMMFPSQSEADLALLSMFTFYSKSNEQCRRLFRQTMLGQRVKANKNDVYLDRTLRIIRSRQQREQSSIAHGEAVALALMAKHAATEQKTPLRMLQSTGVSPKVKDSVHHMDQTIHSNAEPVQLNEIPPPIDGLEWPPGLVGAIAWFIYQSSPRPVKEVSIVAALGLMAGICGKAYNIGQTGLNLYIILIARSAIGKEAMHSGIGHLLRSPCGMQIGHFVDYTDYASGPALTKAMETDPSFVNVSGEWGRKLMRMADDRKEGPMQQLRTVMTNLYQKSGAASVMGGLGYSNKDQNVKSVNAVAYSMIGETTPGTFYDSLTPAMMEDGFLSRFNIVEYLGERPPENKNQVMKVPEVIYETLAAISTHTLGIVRSPNSTAIQVELSAPAKKLYDEFNDYCDLKINIAGADESIRQIWNRAHLKAVRIGGILGASDNHLAPVVTEEHAKWSLMLIRADTSSMLVKIKDGDIGEDDSTRFKKLLSILGAYLKTGAPASYNIDPRMLQEGIIPRKLLQTKTAQIRCFTKYRLGATLALDHTMKTAIDSGYIMEVNKDKAIEMFGYHGRCFRILEV